MSNKPAIPHTPVNWAAATVPVCARHPECWVIPGGVHTSSRNRAGYVARELADLIGPEVPTLSGRRFTIL